MLITLWHVRHVCMHVWGCTCTLHAYRYKNIILNAWWLPLRAAHIPEASHSLCSGPLGMYQLVNGLHDEIPSIEYSS